MTHKPSYKHNAPYQRPTNYLHNIITTIKCRALVKCIQIVAPAKVFGNTTWAIERRYNVYVCYEALAKSCFCCARVQCQNIYAIQVLVHTYQSYTTIYMLKNNYRSPLRLLYDFIYRARNDYIVDSGGNIWIVLLKDRFMAIEMLLRWSRDVTYKQQ